MGRGVEGGMGGAGMRWMGMGYGGVAVWTGAESWETFGKCCGIGQLRAAACAGVMATPGSASRLELYVHTSRHSQDRSYRVKSRRGVC